MRLPALILQVSVAERVLLAHFLLGFVAPMSIVAMLAKNRLFLNLVGGIGMAIGLAFVHGEVLPLYLDGRSFYWSSPVLIYNLARQLSPTTLFGGVPLSSLMSTCLLLSIFSAISYLLTANSIFSRAQV